MHSHRRSRAGIFFESFCALALGASFVLAWMQTRAWALLGSASVFALLGLYWSSGLFARDALAAAAKPTADAEESEVPATFQGAIAGEADVLIDPEPLPKAPAKRRARKARAAKTGDGPAVEPTPAVAVYEPPPSGLPIEPLFDPKPFARQMRPAFGRRAGGSKKLTA